MKLSTILVADDHPLIRKGMVSLLAETFPTVNILEAEHGKEALEQLRRHSIQIALLDIDMPYEDGLSVTSTIRSEGLKTKVIILTLYKEEWMIKKAFDSGASGFILKENAMAEIVLSIKAILQGKRYLSSKITSPAMQNLLNETVGGSAQKSPHADLSKTEREILRHLAMNKTSRMIAKELCISVRTVENHRANIVKKLHLQGRNALLEYALKYLNSHQQD